MRIFDKLLAVQAKDEAANPITLTPPAQSEPEPLPINEISPQALKTRLDKGDNILVIDMRQGWEYQSGHIPGAKQMFVQDIPRRLNELPQEVDLIFQCWHGYTSLEVSAFVIEQGWPADRVASLSGGMAGWVQVHGPSSLVKD